MSKVKLLSNLQTENGVVAEGSVIDLPDADAEHLCALGAAEATDAAVTPAAQPAPKEEVEPAADPLASTQADGESTQTEASPVTQPAPSQVAPPSSSTDLHLS